MSGGWPESYRARKGSVRQVTRGAPMVTSLPARPPRAALALTTLLLVLPGLLGTALITPPARAASLVQVGSFGANPGNLSMYAYRPDGLPGGRPLVVLLHGCTQNASG